MIKSGKNIFIKIKKYICWVITPRAAGDKVKGYRDADFAFRFLFRACGEMFCLWWKVCLSPGSNIYLAQLLSLIQTTQTTRREKWSRESLFEFNLSVTGPCSILRVICQLDRRHIGVIWQWTWHGSCDMTWYDIMTTPVGGHQASKHWYWCCEIGSPGPILTLLLLSGYWHYWGGGCRGGYQCLSGHTEHTSHSWSDLSHLTCSDVGLLSSLSWIRHKNQIMWLSRGT